jgi:hypothetical protein
MGFQSYECELIDTRQFLSLIIESLHGSSINIGSGKRHFTFKPAIGKDARK